MPKQIAITFKYITGLKEKLFSNVRLEGSWTDGVYTREWSSTPMLEAKDEFGCPCFEAKVKFDSSQAGNVFRWGVRLDGPGGKDLWGITTEINDPDSQERYREFTLKPSGAGNQEYHLTHCKRLGAQRAGDGVRFSVWAPNAKKAEVVFGDANNGYIDDTGRGVVKNPAPVEMAKDAEGIWSTSVLKPFSKYDHKPYMFRITKENGTADGQVTYRTDLFSRCQIGSGETDPKGKEFDSAPTELAGTKGCSVVVDPSTVVKNFEDADKLQTEFIPEEEFWKSETAHNGPCRPGSLKEMVIYELHIGSLGFENKGVTGTFDDAMRFVDYLVELGVNTVELMPMSEYEGTLSWGYGTSHYFALEFSAGGRDKFKHVIRELHRRGISVLLDVVYNHYHHDAERAEWMYDSNSHEDNIYYWYEGEPGSYTKTPPGDSGGYVDNMSTGYSPRFWNEFVRKMFISSAAALMENFHLDGFRLDQTTSMHSYNVLHYDGRPMGRVNQYGAKFLREYTRTLRLIKPDVILVAEDHSGWDMVTRDTEAGGMGFDAVWYAGFYHHLIGSDSYGDNYAKLLRRAGFGDDGQLPMSYFAGALQASAGKVVYHESHDEAGNSEGSARTMTMAVNWAPLTGPTRSVAESRSRFAFGMAMLSAGAPMFFMGEEIAAAKKYTFDQFVNHREDLYGEKEGNGARMFRFYQDLISFRKGKAALLPGGGLEILHVHDQNRLLAFRRWLDGEEYVVVASLANRPYENGYWIGAGHLDGAGWREVFNSDSGLYGGQNMGNNGATLWGENGGINPVVPSNGFLVLERTAS